MSKSINDATIEEVRNFREEVIQARGLIMPMKGDMGFSVMMCLPKIAPPDASHLRFKPDEVSEVAYIGKNRGQLPSRLVYYVARKEIVDAMLIRTIRELTASGGLTNESTEEQL